MDFLSIVRASIYGPEYYASLKGKPLSYSIQYFLALAAWLTVVSATLFLISIVPLVNSFLSNAGTSAINYYPAELQITIASGSASTNVPEPYFLKLPASLASDFSSSSYNAPGVPPENLLVIDTKDPITSGEFQNDRTLMLLASDSIAYQKDDSMVTEPIGSDVSMTINKGTVATFVEKLEPYFKYADAIIAIFVPIAIFFVLALRLIYLFLLALLVWLVARIRKIDIGYGQAYRWGLHLMTLPMLITTLFWIFVPSASIPFLFTFFFLIAAAMNIKNIPPIAVSSPSA